MRCLGARCRLLNIFVLSFMLLVAVKGMSMAAKRRSDMAPSLHSSSRKLSDMKDSNLKGIKYERTNVLRLRHLQRTCPGKTLEDFSDNGLQQVYLDYSNPLLMETSEAFLQYLTVAPKSRDGRWEIEITEMRHLGNLTLLSMFIQSLPSLSSLKWKYSSSMPALVLATVESNHPDCRLYYEFSSAYVPGCDDVSDEPAQLAIARDNEYIITTPNLYSLTVNLDYSDTELCVNWVHRVLNTCSNVRELDLNIPRPRFSPFRCCARQITRHAFDFSISNNTLPPLEVLTLQNYDLETGVNGQDLVVSEKGADILRWPWSELPEPIVEYLGYPSFRFVSGLKEGPLVQRPIRWEDSKEETNLDAWMRLMDWTNIHTLNIDHPSNQLSKLAGGFLPNLKHVSLGQSWCANEPVLQFLSNVSALETIVIHDVGYFSPDAFIDIIATHHKKELKNLKLDRTFLESMHLSQLLHYCPDLQSLDINIDRSEQWDYRLLDTLTAFLKLRTLTLRFDYRRIDADQYGNVWNPHMGHNWDNIYDEGHRSDLIDDGDEFVLLALKEYLTNRKLGERFETIRTLVGKLEIPKPDIRTDYIEESEDFMSEF